MGLGKTITSLAAIKENENLCLPALIVCPASVKYTWETEAQFHFGFPSSVCEGRKPPRAPRQGFTRSAPLTIINYDILHYWKDYLKKIGFETVIADEIQKLKNFSAKRTKAFYEVMQTGVPNAMFLSGTPIDQRVVEFWPALTMLWPQYYDSFPEFSNEYCPPQPTPWGISYNKSINTQKLNQELVDLGMLRLRKSDVLHDLPDKTRTIVPLDIKDRRTYELCRDSFPTYLKKHRPEKLRRMMRAPQLSQAGEILRLVARLKIKGVVDWCNEFLEDTDQKLTIACIHRKALDVFERRIKTHTIRIDGSVGPKQRHLLLEQFKRDPRIRCCIANIQAAGTGTDGLQRVCSNMVVAELPWRPADLLQLEDRLYRIGQEDKVNIYYLIGRDTVEERLCRVLQEKQEVLSSVLDGEIKPEDLNLYDVLVELIKSEKLERMK